jgi:hypothetical protein
MHEFSHVSHIDRLIKKARGEKLVNRVQLARKHEPIQNLAQQHRDGIALICNYALKNPLDAIACDLPTRIISCINKENLRPIKNPFITTPYEIVPFWEKIPKTSSNSLDKILKNFWNGKFD